MNTFIKNLDTPIAIVGMGKSGEAALRLLISSGLERDLIASFDSKLESAQFNDPSRLMAEFKPKTLVVSPGVPLTSPWIVEAKKNGLKITSEISLACSVLTSEKIIGITGSVGKSTTVSILGAGLNSFSNSGFVGGNLGTPFAQYAADIIEQKRTPADWIVLELSSYQLENCEGLKLDFSAITYLTSNHLERYDSLEHYYLTKWNILSMTKLLMFLNREGGDLLKYSESQTSDKDKIQFISKHDEKIRGFNLNQALLIGDHNQDNLSLAASIAVSANWPITAIEGMKHFKGLTHRLENLGFIGGIRFINDSKATALDSVIIAANAAILSKQMNSKVLLLLGGRDKNLPWEQLSHLNLNNEIEFIFFGECREVAQRKSNLPGLSFQNLEGALGSALFSARAGDTILLSPGGTSLDEFKSFEERGDYFKKFVEQFSAKRKN